MNTLGKLFRVSSFGESHGSHVGCVIEGCPAGLLFDQQKMQQAVNKRKTAQQDFSSARKESDVLSIVSGVFESKTLGSPICILIKNEDSRPDDYAHLKEVYRPGHADAAYDQKYGHRDHRGGGRSSIRITAPMVAAGELARQLLHSFCGLSVRAFVSQIGEVFLPDAATLMPDQAAIDASVVKCPDVDTSQAMEALINEVKNAGDTLGGSINVVISGVPSGLGEPVFGKFQAELAHAMLNINTAKGFAYGEGINSASMRGSTHNDVFVQKNNSIGTATNHHGGLLGGISSGEDIRFQVWFKPISSIQQPQQTVNTALESLTLNIGGRHDVCAVPRAVAIVEAYTYIIAADLFLHHKLARISS